MNLQLRLIAAACAAGLAGNALALQVGERVDNFELLDQHGRAHELHYLSDARAVALMAHSTRCDATERDVQRFERLAASYADKGVAFLLVNSDGLADRRVIGEVSLPVLVDEARLIGESLGFVSAGEALLVATDGWRLAYRGGGGEQLAPALDALLAGESVPSGDVPGECTLQNASAPADVTYVDDVAPLLIQNCVTCHREGGIGPWAMTNYAMVRGFAPMIREVVRTRRMPPWHADPMHGDFANDRSLTTDETRMLVHWAEAGAPRGEGADPLAGYEGDWPMWQMGEPDVVIDIPPFEVPASGVVEYQYPYVLNPLEEDVWVRGAEILPGDRSALHHVITSWRELPAGGERRRGRRGSLGGYVPGRVADPLPDNTGRFFPAGSVIVFQMHYTPYGKATTDRSKLGLYLHDEPPKHRLGGAVLMNNKIRIPAHAKAHSDTAEHTFRRDVLVYDLLPHAHYRGKASEFRAFYPDGGEEVLLSVPNYDFNWQTTYVYKEPKVLPAGTRVVHRTWWDNSAQNPANPDPTVEVPWGLQSWHEMLFGAIGYRYLDEGERVAEASTEAGGMVSAEAGE